MSLKKENIENDILSCIFKEDRHCKINKSEQPDFILHYQGNLIGEVHVGVEITELYFDNTSARLKNKPNYIKDLIENNKFAHKEDKQKLEVKEIRYYPKDRSREPFDTKVIINPNYTIEDYRASLLKTILKKGEKHKKYNSTVNQSVLVIYDTENILSKYKREDFIRVLFNEKICDGIKNSPFEEVYLITRFENDHKEYYVQLKHCVLQNELSCLLEYLNINNLNRKRLDLNLTYNDVFFEVLIKKGYFGVGRSQKNNIPVVSCIRYSFHIDEYQRKLSVFDDFPKLIEESDDYSVLVLKEFFTKKSFNRYVNAIKNMRVSFDVGFTALRNRKFGEVS